MIVIDNFIHDTSLLNELASETLKWPIQYHWADFDFEATDTYLKTVEYIWRKFPQVTVEGVEGFEYWTGIYSEGDRKEVKQNNEFFHLNIHFDKDETLCARTGEIKTPLISTVFYPCKENDDVIGGELKIWETNNQEPNFEIFEMIRPKFNRLVIFDSSMIHAVALVKKGIRKAIAINLWGEKPETFNE